MTKTVFNISFLNGGYIRAMILHKAAKGNPCKADIIRLDCRNSRGSDFIHADMTPKEALYIADALLHAVNRRTLTNTKPS